MNQPELSAEAAAGGSGVSDFETARARWPGCKFLLIFDQRAPVRRTWHRILVAIDKRSSWYDLLPDEQMTAIRDLDQPAAIGAFIEYALPSPDRPL